MAVVTGDGTVELNKNVVNGSEPMLRLIGDLPPGTPVAFEAAFGWGWLAGLLEDYGFEAHLVHPLRCKAIASARLKNDKGRRGDPGPVAARGPAPGGAGRPPAVRQLRALLRHRAGLVRLGTQQQNRIHAVVADFGFDRSGSYLSGPGRGWLAGPGAARDFPRDRDRRPWRSPAGLAPLTDRIDGELRQHAKADPRARTLTTLPGVGQFTALVMLAEIGDISRFGSARKLASWAGLTPTVRGPGPDRAARAHPRAGLGLAAAGHEPGGADRQTVPGILRQLRRHRLAAREEDRHHRDLPQAAAVGGDRWLARLHRPRSGSRSRVSPPTSMTLSDGEG